MELQTRAYDDVKSLAMEIQRPRSALHAGDFTEDLQPGENHCKELSRPALSSVFPSSHGLLGTSPTSPWYTPSTPASSFYEKISPLHNDFHHRNYDDVRERRSARDRTPSLAGSYTSHYILKAPTTPLVQQSNNTDLDFSAQTAPLAQIRPAVAIPFRLMPCKISGTGDTRQFRSEKTSHRSVINHAGR